MVAPVTHPVVIAVVHREIRRAEAVEVARIAMRPRSEVNQSPLRLAPQLRIVQQKNAPATTVPAEIARAAKRPLPLGIAAREMWPLPQ